MEIAIAVSVGVGAFVGIILGCYATRYDIALDRNIDDKLRELPSIFRDAQHSVKIATDFDARFFDQEIVKNAIGSAISNEVKVQFLTEAEAPEWYQQQESIDIKRVQTLSQHVMTIDNHHVRLERRHPPLEFGNRGSDIALIFSDFPALGERCSQEFDKLWMQTS